MGSNMKKSTHWFRGVISLIVLGPIFLVCALNLVVLMVRNFLSGLDTFNWFSNNGVDWIFGFGFSGGAGMYFGFMFYGLIVFGCASCISWAFTDSWIES